MKPPSATEQAQILTGSVSPALSVALPATIIHTPVDLGALIAARRKARNFTQQEFADLAGVGRRFLSELESGKATVETGKVLQVLNALGLDLVVRER